MFNCNAKVNEEAGEGNSFRYRNELPEEELIDVEWFCTKDDDSFCYCILFLSCVNKKFIDNFLNLYSKFLKLNNWINKIIFKLGY